jgi:phosphoribosyl-ATP pyrophosphohydrolase
MAVPGTDASFVPALADFLASRLRDAPEGSYSHAVMADSVVARRKIMEEAFEVCLELGTPVVERQRLAEEAADLVFHLLCGLTGAGVAWSDVEAVLVARHHGEPR